MESFKNYINEVKRIHEDAAVTKLRCDNAREYIRGDLEKFCKETGITIDPSDPYTPEQNGKAERLEKEMLVLQN